MNKKTIGNLLLCFLGSILVILYLQWTSVRPNQFKNNFVRIFPSHFAVQAGSMELPEADSYIVGLSSRYIYTANYARPGEIMVVPWEFKQLTKIHINIPDSERVMSSMLRVTLDSPSLFVNNLAIGSVYTVHLDKLEVKMIKLPLPPHSSLSFMPFSKSSFAIRTFDRETDQNVLAKVEIDGSKVNRYRGLLEKQQEGIFSTDGMLEQSTDKKRLIYIYFYRNQIICLDTNFRIQYRAVTIDTNTTAKIRVLNEDSGRTHSFASPGYYVNRSACISNQWILINSDLKADNETDDVFDRYAVIDVYGLKDGQYHYSFYLLKSAGKISDMAILNDRLVTLQGKSLFFYKLTMPKVVQ